MLIWTLQRLAVSCAAMGELLSRGRGGLEREQQHLLTHTHTHTLSLSSRRRFEPTPFLCLRFLRLTTLVLSSRARAQLYWYLSLRARSTPQLAARRPTSSKRFLLRKRLAPVPVRAAFQPGQPWHPWSGRREKSRGRRLSNRFRRPRRPCTGA